MTKMLLPGTLDWTPIRVPDVQTVVYDVTREIPQEHRDALVLVAWGNPGEALRAAAATLPRLRWAATLAAGADAIRKAGFGPGVALTSGVGLHTLPVTEHALALLLAAARRLHELRDAQSARTWAACSRATNRAPSGAWSGPTWSCGPSGRSGSGWADTCGRWRRASPA